MDGTAFAICLGLLTCAAYACVRGKRQQSFDVGATLLMFLAGGSLPIGIALIWCGISGNSATLPTFWRQYVAFAGVGALGLTGPKLVTAFRAAWTRSASVEVSPTDVAGKVRVDPPTKTT